MAVIAEGEGGATILNSMVIVFFSCSCSIVECMQKLNNTYRRIWVRVKLLASRHCAAV
jgi:hypothetical protein